MQSLHLPAAVGQRSEEHDRTAAGSPPARALWVCRAITSESLDLVRESWFESRGVVEKAPFTVFVAAIGWLELE